MSVKKILSGIMALAMVLTMASFPAFAGESVQLTPVSYTSNHTSFNSGNLASAFDLDASGGTHFKSSKWVSKGLAKGNSNNINIYLEFDGEYNITSVYLRQLSAYHKTFTLYGATNGATAGSDWVELVTYDGCTTGRGTYTVSHTGYYKYIRIEAYNLSGGANAGFYEVTFFGEAKPDASAATTYTVKYVDTEGKPLAGEVTFDDFVGNDVTVEALDIEGYLPDVASKTVTLVDGTNEIKFTYTKRTAATYTVNYVDTEGTPIADAKVVTEGYYEDDVVTETAATVPGYKPTETSREVTLAAGENTITFTYEQKDSATYVINYVDAQGNPVASATTGEDYEGEVITAVAPVISGYFYTGSAEDTVIDYTKSITLDADDEINVINFVYKKVLTPATTSATKLGGISAFNDTSRLWDGMIAGAVSAASDGAQLGTLVADGGNIAEVVYKFDGLYEINTLTAYWNKDKYATGVEIYTSIDGDEWTLVYETEEVVYTEKVYANTSVKSGSTLTAQVSEFALESSVGAYVKYVVTGLNGEWVRFYEIEVEGVPATSVELSGNNVTAGSKWGWAKDPVTNGTVSTLFDGNLASLTEGFFNYDWSGSVMDCTNADVIAIDLGGVIDNPILTVQGGLSGGGDKWGYSHLMAYEVYVAGVDGVYGEEPVGTVDYSSSEYNNTVKYRTDLFVIKGEAIRYIKIVPTGKTQRTVLGEITVYGTLTDVGEHPEDTIATLGGQIRLPQGSISAGIRFGATVLKETVGIEGEYVYDPAATTTFGMFLIPKDLLAGATFAEYLAANDYAGQALKVPAQRIYSQDDYSVEFTAVLVDIPEGQYTRDIVAIPYICTEGVYTFSSEIVRNYAEVATSVAAKYEAGEVALSATQITLIEGIIGRPLVAPEVAE